MEFSNTPVNISGNNVITWNFFILTSLAEIDINVNKLYYYGIGFYPLKVRTTYNPEETMSANQAHINPLHPQALAAEDLKTGVCITRFNIYYGIIGRYEVLASPAKTTDDTYDLTTTVHMRNIASRNEILSEDNHHLCDLGVLPYFDGCNGWHGANFIVLTEDEIHLPASLGVLADPSANSFGNESEQNI